MAPEVEPGPGADRLDALMARVEKRFIHTERAVFGVQVPLRICPLGAHIDHQGGRVTGMTIDRSVRLAGAPADGAVVEVESTGFEGTATVDLGSAPGPQEGNWGDFLRAAVAVLGARHRLRHGFRAIVDGDFEGSGLSSSAAVLIAYLTALAELNGLELGPVEGAELVREAENEHIGVACGLLDPAVILNGEAGSLTHIDCRDGAVRQVRRGPGSQTPAVIAVFSGQARTLASSGFNTRVEECRSAARRLLELAGEPVPASPRLSDVRPEIYAAWESRLPAESVRRARHYFGEMERVEAGVAAWSDGDLHRFGELVSQSGESSIANYECGTPPLIDLYGLLRATPGVYGTRFSGGGFGGTCIALAEPEACGEIIASVKADYAELRPELAASAVFATCRPAGSVLVRRREA